MLPPAPDEQSLQSTGICQHGYSLDFRLKNQRTYDSLKVFEAIEFANVARTELPTPMPNGFVGDDDAWFSQKIFHKAKAQTETVIKPDGMADDLGREAMAAVAGGQKLLRITYEQEWCPIKRVWVVSADRQHGLP